MNFIQMTFSVGLFVGAITGFMAAVLIMRSLYEEEDEQ